MHLPSSRPRLRRRLLHGLTAVAVLGLHVGLLALLRPDGTLEEPPPPSNQTVVSVILVPSAKAPHATRRRQRQAAARAAPAPAFQPHVSRSRAKSEIPPPTGPATGSPGATGQDGAGVGPGVLWDEQQGALRRALRTSVGCDQEGLRLTEAERATCDERFGRGARKGAPQRASADPKKAAAIAAEGAYQRDKYESQRRNDWPSAQSEDPHGWLPPPGPKPPKPQ